MQILCSQNTTTIVALWATWCSPCKKQLDAIAKLYPDWREEYDTQLVAVSIDTKRSAPKIAPMSEAKGWEYLLLNDPNEELKNAIGAHEVPHLVLFDQSCTKIYEHSGFLPGDEYDLEDQLISSVAAE